MAWDCCQIGSPLGSSEPSGSNAVSIVDAFQAKAAIKAAKIAKRIWRAALEAGFSFMMHSCLSSPAWVTLVTASVEIRVEPPASYRYDCCGPPEPFK